MAQHDRRATNLDYSIAFRAIIAQAKHAGVETNTVEFLNFVDAIATTMAENHATSRFLTNIIHAPLHKEIQS